MGAPYDKFDYAPLDTYGFEALAVSSTAVGFTVATADHAKRAIVRVESNSVRWRADGTNPTATVGMPLEVGDELVVWGTDIHTIKFIRQSADATLSVSFAR